jgi:hypothetical protein
MEVMCLKTYKLGILFVLAILTLVSVGAASPIDGSVTHLGTNSYFDLSVNPGDLVVPTGSYTDTWCVDNGGGNYINPGQVYTFNVISSLTNPQFSYLARPIHWQEINYLLNNHATWFLTSTEIQDVIWHYDGLPLTNPGGNVGLAIGAIDTFLLAHPGWTPPCSNGVYAVLLDADETVDAPPVSGTHIQLIFVERPYTCPDPGIPAPEFPTLALPVAMIVGMLGLVYTVRNREN